MVHLRFLPGGSYFCDFILRVIRSTRRISFTLMRWLPLFRLLFSVLVIFQLLFLALPRIRPWSRSSGRVRVRYV